MIGAKGARSEKLESHTNELKSLPNLAKLTDHASSSRFLLFAPR